MEQTLDRRLLKKIMRRYFINTARLLLWRRNGALEELERRILELMLEVQKKTEYRDACLGVLADTAQLQTLADCNVLKLNMGQLSVEASTFYDMKADNLKYYEIEETQVFDMDILVMDNRQAVIKGDPGAIRLAALLSWLGLDEESGPEAALRYWKVIAYTGDYFAMEALEYAYRRRGELEQAALWRTVREIFAEADRNFTITVPERWLEHGDQEAVDTAQVILAVRRRCADDDTELLPVLLLQYAIDSTDAVDVKVRNLYAPAQAQAFQELVSAKMRRKTRPLGFAI